MDEPDSALPRLEAQRPAVDFISNHLPQHHEAFSNPSVHYDRISGDYVPNNQALLHRPNTGSLVQPVTLPSSEPQSLHGTFGPSGTRLFPPRPEWTDAKAMVFWNRSLPEALSKFRSTTTEPRGRSKTEYSIRNDDNWDAIYDKLEKARNKYQNEGGKVGWLRKVRRRAADNITPVAEVTRNISQLVPDSPFSTPVLGSVQVLLDAVKTSAELRSQVVESFESIIPVFSDVELFLGTFPKDKNIQNAALGLTVATLEAIEAAIGFFLRNEVVKGVRALGMGTAYESSLVKSLEEIKTKSQALMEEATKSHIFEFHIYSQETWKIGKRMFERQTKIAADVTDIKDLFADHIVQRDRELAIERERHRREIQAAQSEIVYLRIENGMLRSVSPGPQGPWPAPQHQQQPFALEGYVNQDMLRQAFGIYDIDLADIAYVVDKKGEFPARELAHAEQVVNARLFREWITSPSSAKLLVHWDRNLPKMFANLSPLSLFSASIAQMLQGHDRFMTAIWFCGLHADPAEGPVGGRIMVACLIDQLLRQHEFDPRSLAGMGVNLEALQDSSLESLLVVLESLVYQLPETITLVCLVDNAILYERDEMDALSVFSALLRLVGDSNMRAALKLLFTSTPGTDIVRGAFEEHGLILNIDTLPRLGWAPNDERVARELGESLAD